MIGKNKQLQIFASRILRCGDDLYLYRLIKSIPDGRLKISDRHALCEAGFPTDYLDNKQDILNYLNKEAPKYIKRYRKATRRVFHCNAQEPQFS